MYSPSPSEAIQSRYCSRSTDCAAVTAHLLPSTTANCQVPGRTVRVLANPGERTRQRCEGEASGVKSTATQPQQRGSRQSRRQSGSVVALGTLTPRTLVRFAKISQRAATHDGSADNTSRHFNGIFSRPTQHYLMSTRSTPAHASDHTSHSCVAPPSE